jgi:YidC/Oxa1 family membrane protein insertase
MMLVSPIISLWIGFSMPGLMSLYWVGNGVCQALKDFVLTRHYKAILDVEDAARDAVRSAREAELEAKRQETLLLKAEGEVIDNPNLSKKKKEQLEKEERERKKREWEENSGRKKAVKNAGSGVSEAAVGDRPYARGRAYKEERYNRSGVKLLAEADTELEAKTVEVVDAQIDVKVTTEVVEASAETIVDAVVETTDGKTNKKSKKRELTAGGIVEIPVESEEEK